METAPFHSEVADAPEGGVFFWRHADDGVRLRLGAWREGDRGSVLLLNGRTEYLEKYGSTVRDLQARGYAAISLDWRGQGLSDRLLPDPEIGHVERFPDYQKDMAELVAAAEELDMPRPWFLLGHSMGGAIGLRALHEGLDVRAAAFSAPMWGILIAPWLRPLAIALASGSRWIGQRHRYAPGTGPDSYVATAPFDDNLLTTDRKMYEMMQRQLAAHPELALGGPSLGWLHEALAETRALARLPAPETPGIVFLGANERIVDARSVIARIRGWPRGELDIIPGAEHEVLMETPEVRQHVHALMERLFSSATADS